MTDFTLRLRKIPHTAGSWFLQYFYSAPSHLERLALYQFSSNHFRASLVGVAVKPRWGTRSSLSSALFGILWGYIADRFGTRWFGLIAALAMSASLFALSQQQSIWQFYGCTFYWRFWQCHGDIPTVCKRGFLVHP